MTEEQTEPRGGGKKKTLILVVALLAIEAAAIIGVMMFLGGPADVAATDELGNIIVPEEEMIVEIPILQDKLHNTKSGATYVYNTEIYVQVKRKYEQRVLDELEQFRHEIKAEISAIWRSSDPRHFEEPRHENLTRKVEALLTERFGIATDEEEPVIAKCVIVMGSGFRIDG